jgi:hypothetical protein
MCETWSSPAAYLEYKPIKETPAQVIERLREEADGEDDGNQ